MRKDPLAPTPDQTKNSVCKTRKDSINVLKHIADAKYFAAEFNSYNANFWIKNIQLHVTDRILYSSLDCYNFFLRCIEKKISHSSDKACYTHLAK